MTNSDKQKHCKRKNGVIYNLSYYRGIIYALISGFLCSLPLVIVKYIKGVPSMELVFFRYLCVAVISLPIAVYSRESLLGCKGSRLTLFLTAISGIVAIFLTFMSIRYLPVADATIICYSRPVFLTITAKVLLKEPCGYPQVFASLLTIVGIALISKTPTTVSGEVKTDDKYNHIYGISGAVGALICGIGFFIFFRKAENVHNSVFLFTSGLAGILFAGVILLATRSFTYPSCGLDLWLIPCVGLCSFFSRLFLQLGLNNENTGPFDTVHAASNIMSIYLWQIFFFNEIPNIYNISGAVLVCSCILIISINKWITSLSDDTYVKNLRKYLLQTLRK